MPHITYISHTGQETTVDVPNGMTLMHGALLNNIPGLLAECGGAMICATCHVYIDKNWLTSIDIAESAERQKLTTVNKPQSNSRLACQIPISDDLDGLRVYLPVSQVWNR